MKPKNVFLNANECLSCLNLWREFFRNIQNSFFHGTSRNEEAEFLTPELSGVFGLRFPFDMKRMFIKNFTSELWRKQNQNRNKFLKEHLLLKGQY